MTLTSSMPVVAVVGRPNVGKSTLVNRLAGKRQAIVDDRPGVTRDRSYHAVSWRGRRFWCVDTGGLLPTVSEHEPFAQQVNAQIEMAVQEADVVVFLVDGLTGVTDDDLRVAQKLRGMKKPLLLAVNKVDAPDALNGIYEFYELGLGEPYGLSALHGDVGVGDLLDKITKLLPTHPLGDETEPPLKLSLVGRPNVGKSSIVNALLGEERSIVSPISGTTRDAIDTPFTYQGKPYVLVDTAGIRRKTKVDYGVELFSVDRAIHALRRSDVVILVLDAEEGLTDQDKRIAQKVIDSGRCLVVAVNKWDLIPNKGPNATKEAKAKLLEAMPNLGFAPFIFISAHEKQRLHRLLTMAQTVFTNAQRRISTNVLNQVVQDAMERSPSPVYKTRRFTVYYVTQVKTEPPTFVFFCNEPNLVKPPYERFLERSLRERIELEGVPVRFVFRERKRSPSKKQPAKVR